MEAAQIQNILEHFKQDLVAQMQGMFNKFQEQQLTRFSDYDKKYPSGWLTTTQYATECGITKDGVVARIKAGKITNYRQPSKNSTYLICITELKKSVG